MFVFTGGEHAPDERGRGSQGDFGAPRRERQVLVVRIGRRNGYLRFRVVLI